MAAGVAGVGSVERLHASARGERRVDFEIVGEIRDIEQIAVGRSIRHLPRLRKDYGVDGVGRKEFKIKRLLD